MLCAGELSWTRNKKVPKKRIQHDSYSQELHDSKRNKSSKWKSNELLSTALFWSGVVIAPLTVILVNVVEPIIGLIIGPLSIMLIVCSFIIPIDKKNDAKKKPQRKEETRAENEVPEDKYLEETSEEFEQSGKKYEAEDDDNGLNSETVQIKSQADIDAPKQDSDTILYPFDLLTGVQFKDLIETYFHRKGYSVQRITPRINNIDFIIQKGDMVTALATRKTFDLIYRSYVKKVIESAKFYNTKNITIITTSYFAIEAQQLAKECGIMLWDSEILKTKLGGSK